MLSAALRGDEAAVVTILTAGGAGGEVDRALDVVFVWVVGSKNIYGVGEGKGTKKKDFTAESLNRSGLAAPVPQRRAHPYLRAATAINHDPPLSPPAATPICLSRTTPPPLP
jgi:hypothetical protein